MARLFFLVLSAGLLSACAQFPEWPLLPGHLPATSPQEEASNYSFAWRLSGNRQAAPLQVFDNGKQTWLQFAPGQAIPAIFQHSDAGDRPLRYQRQGPYVVLAGVWPALSLRIGQLESRIERIATPAVVAATIPVSATDQFAAVGAPVPVPEPAAAKSDVAVFALTRPDAVTSLTQASFQAIPVVAEPDASISLPVIQSDSASISRYSVSPQDSNLRSALSRWATDAGWTFEPEHWAVDVDIPIVGSATFETGFKPAVQDLLASTELADRPLQPCFYSNLVLRIVPYAQTCDRSAGVAS